jgi:hypothetical protein
MKRILGMTVIVEATAATMQGNRRSLRGLAIVAALTAAGSLMAAGDTGAAPASSSASATTDWPQFCGPNRDSVVVNSPKLLDAWPKEGPPLVWKSDWVPGWIQGGCGGPAVADGKVFVYATAKNPVGGGALYKLVTPEVLAAAGWQAVVPDDLAQKVEEARTQKGRPKSDGWMWVDIHGSKETEAALDAFLAKKPELDKYIKDFMATLKPEDAAKYGGLIRKRLCMASGGQRGKGPSGMEWDQGAIAWDDLVSLSKLQGVGYPTLREWAGAWSKATHQSTLVDHLGIGGYFPGFFYAAWMRCYTRTDTLACLDAATGRTLWKKDFPVDAEIQTKLNLNGGTHNATAYLGLCGTPAVADGKCYFGGLMGLYCVSTKDGALLWHAKRPTSNTSALVANGVVSYCGVAYDGATGRLLWKTPLWKDGDAGWGNNTPPALWRSGGRTYIISGNGADSICSLDLENGKDGWTLKVRNYSGFGPANFAIRADGDFLVADNKVYRMTPTELQSLRTLGETVSRSGFDPGVLFQDNYYAETTGGEGGATKMEGLCCWDFKTGELRWSGPFIQNSFCAPPMVADGKMITVFGVPGQEGYQFNNWKVAMIQATPERYIELGSFAPGLIPWTPMALAGGKLYVRTEAGISCYDLVQHGTYLDKTVVTKDKVTFAFQQTGGGLVERHPTNDLQTVVLTDAKGTPTPANTPNCLPNVTLAGDTLVVDIKGLPVPFGISCGNNNAFAGKNGTPVPAFGWDEARVLKFRTCFDNTIVLTCDRLLPQNGTWNAGASYAIAGATVTNARIDPLIKTVTLEANKAWKAGEGFTLTYPDFPVDQGEPRRGALTITAREATATRFVKTNETTSGSWKGVYGSQGALIAGDAAATAKCAVVVTVGPNEGGIWAASTNDVRALQKWGDTKDRVAGNWSIRNPTAYFHVALEFTDGKEHQVAVYCLDWDKFGGGRAMTVEMWDPWRNVLLDKHTVTDFANGKYLVWKVKGEVELRFQSANGAWCNAVLSGIFFDPLAAGKPETP